MPDGWGRLQIAIDYYDIEIENGVTQAGAPNILDLCYNDPEFSEDGSFCRLVDRDPDNSLTVRDSFINLSNQVVTGIDYTVRYGTSIGPGEFSTDLLLSQFTTQEFRLFPDDPADDYNGDILSPEWVGQLDLTYQWDAWRVRWTTDWTGSMDSYEAIFGEPGLNQANTGYDLEVSDYFVHDLSLQYSNDDKWSITGGVRNLFDEEPPTITTAPAPLYRVGEAPLYSGYDYLGRQYFVNVSYTF
jgi:outer membrane receptor protein involved in Fe transport